MEETAERLTPALLQLLAACVALKTTDTKALAGYLNRTEGTIRIEFCRIFALLNVKCRYTAIRIAEERGWLGEAAQRPISTSSRIPRASGTSTAAEK